MQLVVGRSKYMLPEDWVQGQRLYLRGTRDVDYNLQPVTPKEMLELAKQLTPRGMPRRYCIHPTTGVVEFHPAPNANYEIVFLEMAS